ncbi:MAG: tetratricopeptide repeat protein, partial [SAR324 cluster bacterium]|nr:tetratricopeptide repeat protein [SAR324 cluster bacterium]
RALESLFEVQDEITVKVVLESLKELEVKLSQEDVARSKHDTTVNVKAWEHYAEGMEYYRRYRQGYNSLALWAFEEALELDPEFEPAILGIGWTRYADAVWWSNFDFERAQNLESALEMARRALALNDTLAEPYVLLSQVYLARRQHEQAIAYGRRAIALNPNRAEWYTYLAGTLNLSGNHEEALRMINKAMRFSPFPSDLSRVTMGRVLYQEGRYEEAINNFRGIVKRKKVCSSLIGLSNVFLAASFGALGRPAEFPIILFPTYPIEKLLSFKDSADEKRLLDDLAKAKVKSRRG